MSDVFLVFCTFPDSEQARQIGRLLVERQLAACVNLLPAVESIYRWQDEVETATETLVIFKTTAAAYPAFAETLADLHPYDVPEIVAVKPAQVATPYEAWLKSGCSGGPG